MNLDTLPTFDEVPANGVRLKQAASALRMSIAATQGLAHRKHAVLGFLLDSDSGEVDVIVARALVGAEPAARA